MNYVELLRVRNVLRIFAIVGGIVFIIAAILRIAAAPYIGMQAAAVEHRYERPGAKVTQRTLADGTMQTAIVEPNGERVVISRGSDDTIVINHNAHASTAPSSVVSEHVALEADRNPSEPIAVVLATAEIAGMIVATILGCSLACEADGHLEYALLKPATRARVALEIFAADAVGIIGALVLGAVATVAVTLLFVVPHFTFDNAGLLVIKVLLLPLAWWAMLQVLTTGMRRGYGAVVGLAWPIALGIVGGSFLEFPTAVGELLHAVLTVLSYLIPFRFGSIAIHASVVTGIGFTALAALAAQAVVYAGLAIVRWQRVEA